MHFVRCKWERLKPRSTFLIVLLLLKMTAYLQASVRSFMNWTKCLHPRVLLQGCARSIVYRPLRAILQQNIASNRLWHCSDKDACFTPAVEQFRVGWTMILIDCERTNNSFVTLKHCSTHLKEYALTPLDLCQSEKECWILKGWRLIAAYISFDLNWLLLSLVTLGLFASFPMRAGAPPPRQSRLPGCLQVARMTSNDADAK